MREEELIIIEGPEQERFIPELPDGGVPPLAGVESYQVFRACREAPELSDGLGFTYHHHVDVACWRRRLYVGWNSCERDEDVWPSRELYSTSEDGREWSRPAELFPMGESVCLRMYFYYAANGRMLAIAGIRRDRDEVEEDAKGGLLVREIRADHTLGEVFILQAGGPRKFAEYVSSGDRGFVEACGQLLANNVFLEQQDRGVLLRERKMVWHNAAAWPGGKVPGDSEKWVAGKAWSFVRRADGAILGVSKMGWTTLSTDGGKTWEQPRVPPTLVTGKAKVFAVRTRDGRYALVYNPTRSQRWPLVIVSGEDGMRYRGMRVVQGELPVQRYEGMHRSVGPQYVRGISAWSDDGSRGEDALWVVYSMNKEDIWVSRVGLPIDAYAKGWNIYSPKWSPVRLEGDGVRMEQGDPFDRAMAMYVFGEKARAEVSFEAVREMGDGALKVELVSEWGSVSKGFLIVERSGRYTVKAEGAQRGVFRVEKHEAQSTKSETNEKLQIRNPKQRKEVGGYAHPTDRPGETTVWRIGGLVISGT